MQRFKKILCFCGTDDQDTAINRSVTLAIENEAQLTLLDVVKPLPHAIGLITETADPKELEQLVAEDHRDKLLQKACEFSDTAVDVDVVVSIGDPVVEIIREVVDGDFDLVIKTGDGLGSAGRLFGSVARSLLRNCPCPVWVLKPEVHGEFDTVLAAIDVEAVDQPHRDLNRNTLELAYSIAQKENADLHIVSAWDLWMEQPLRRRSGDREVDAALEWQQRRVRQAIDELLQGPIAKDLRVHVHVLRGPAAGVIQAVADDIQADLMVMGTVCRTGAAGFLIGNTAETVLSGLTCSVLALKPTGFVSPLAPTKRQSIDEFGAPTLL